MKIRPNHFVSLPLQRTDQCIESIRETQRAIVEADAQLAEMTIPTCRFHISLGLLSIQPEFAAESIRTITQALEDVC